MNQTRSLSEFTRCPKLPDFTLLHPVCGKGNQAQFRRKCLLKEQTGKTLIRLLLCLCCLFRYLCRHLVLEIFEHLPIQEFELVHIISVKTKKLHHYTWRVIRLYVGMFSIRGRHKCLFHICTVVPTRSDSDVMFSLQSYQDLRIDRSLVY